MTLILGRTRGRTLSMVTRNEGETSEEAHSRRIRSSTCQNFLSETVVYRELRELP